MTAGTGYLTKSAAIACKPAGIEPAYAIILSWYHKEGESCESSTQRISRLIEGPGAEQSDV